MVVDLDHATEELAVPAAVMNRWRKRSWSWGWT